MNNIKNIPLNFFLIFILLAFSGINLFIYNKNLLVAYFLILATLFLYHKKKFDWTYAIVIISIIAINILQYFSFEFFSFSSFSSTAIIVSIGYMTVKLTSHNFIRNFIFIVYYLALISLILWLLSSMIPSFFSFLVSLPRVLRTDPYEFQNLIIYTVEQSKVYGFYRNAGFVYEPGIFAVFLIIALILNTFTANITERKNIIFIISIISTFSTVGYIALFIYFITYYLLNSKSKFRYIVITLVFILSYLSFTNFNFLGPKLFNQINESGYKTRQYTNTGRIGSGLVDAKSILRYPIAGRGRNIATRFDLDVNDSFDLRLIHRTNGIFDLAAEFGIPFSLLYLYFIYRSFLKIAIFNKINKYYALFAVLILLVLGFSQTIFMRPFVISLMFIYPSLDFKKINENDSYLYSRS